MPGPVAPNNSRSVGNSGFPFRFTGSNPGISSGAFRPLPKRTQAPITASIPPIQRPHVVQPVTRRSPHLETLGDQCVNNVVRGVESHGRRDGGEDLTGAVVLIILRRAVASSGCRHRSDLLSWSGAWMRGAGWRRGPSDREPSRPRQPSRCACPCRAAAAWPAVAASTPVVAPAVARSAASFGYRARISSTMV